MWVPTALFVSCLIAFELYSTARQRHRINCGRKSSESVANRRTAARHRACPALAGSEAHFALTSFLQNRPTRAI